MKRLLTIIVFFSMLSSCSSSANHSYPITESFKASVVVKSNGDEYRLDVKKDSDQLAEYVYTYPDSIENLTYNYVGSKGTVTYINEEISLTDDSCGIVPILHSALCNKGNLEYKSDSNTFVGQTDNFSYSISTISDGNLSVITVDSPPISYFFDFKLQ